MSSPIIAHSDTEYKPLTFAQVREAAQRAGLPVAREIAPGVCAVPSATRAGVVYTVTVLSPTEAVCSCIHATGCWHGLRAIELVYGLTPAVASPGAAAGAYRYPPTVPASRRLLDAALARTAAVLATLAAPAPPAPRPVLYWEAVDYPDDVYPEPVAA